MKIKSAKPAIRAFRLTKTSFRSVRKLKLSATPGLRPSFYYTVRDIEADTEGPAAIQPKETIGSPSELGTLLKAQDAGGIRFADKPLEVFERLKKIAEEQDNPNSEYQTNLKDEIFNNAPYNINQIGDFLDYVEVETTYRQTLEELKASLDEVNDMLKEQLVEAGFTPTADFDISKDEDYELARSSLDRLKKISWWKRAFQEFPASMSVTTKWLKNA